MAKRKQHGDAGDVPETDETNAITLGGEQPSEAFSDRADDAPAEYSADGIATAEPDPDDTPPTSGILTTSYEPAPWWHVEALCPTPVAVKSIVCQAENRAEAEAIYRQRSGLTGAIAGGLHIREAEAEEIEAHRE